MKRSEMIERLIAIKNDPAITGPEDEKNDMVYASFLLSIFERIGMLPPPIPGAATAKIKNRCRWEPEDEEK